MKNSARLIVALLATFLFGASAAATAHAQTCYPVGAVGCEEPGVKPTEVTNPGPDGNPDPAVDPPSSTLPDELPATGVDSAVWLGLGVGLVVLGGGAVIAGRRRESVDA